MPEAKHTPGPWGVIGDNLGCKNIYRLGESDGAGGIFAIAEIGYTHGLSDECEDEANARLIAAAPELLAACETALTFAHTCATGAWQQLAKADRQYHYENYANNACNALEAAIAKAKGAT